MSRAVRVAFTHRGSDRHPGGVFDIRAGVASCTDPGPVHDFLAGSDDGVHEFETLGSPADFASACIAVAKQPPQGRIFDYLADGACGHRKPCASAT
jgi:hypothetical protein